MWPFTKSDKPSKREMKARLEQERGQLRQDLQIIQSSNRRLELMARTLELKAKYE